MQTAQQAGRKNGRAFGVSIGSGDFEKIAASDMTLAAAWSG